MKGLAGKTGPAQIDLPVDLPFDLPVDLPVDPCGRTRPNSSFMLRDLIRAQDNGKSPRVSRLPPLSFYREKPPPCSPATCPEQTTWGLCEAASANNMDQVSSRLSEDSTVCRQHSPVARRSAAPAVRLNALICVGVLCCPAVLKDETIHHTHRAPRGSLSGYRHTHLLVARHTGGVEDVRYRSGGLYMRSIYAVRR